MTDINKLIADKVEEFDRKFPQLCEVIEHDKPLDNVTSDVRNFFRTTLTEISQETRKQVVERLKRMKKLQRTLDGIDNDEVADENLRVSGYNRAVEDIIKALENKE